MYTIKKVANGNAGLFHKDLFCGIISEDKNRLTQFSGNSGSTFDENVCINYMLQFNTVLYSTVSSTGNQLHLIITTNPYKLEEGNWTVYKA